jgi:poly(ADP-ribose) glycohydrolase ARH3
MASSDPPLLNEVATGLPDSVVRDRLLSLAGLESTISIAEAARKNGTSGFVADSVPLALFASRQVSRLGFTEMLEQIIKVGGDTDTIASIACQVAGAAIGLSRIPSHLIERLPDRAMIMDVANRFANEVGKSQ